MSICLCGKWLAASWTVIIILTTVQLSTKCTVAVPVPAENEAEVIDEIPVLGGSEGSGPSEEDEDKDDEGYRDFQRAKKCTLAAAKAGKHGCRLCCPSENSILADCVCPEDGCRAREEGTGGDDAAGGDEDAKIPCASDLAKEEKNKGAGTGQMAELYKKILKVLRNILRIVSKQQKQQEE